MTSRVYIVLAVVAISSHTAAYIGPVNRFSHLQSTQQPLSRRVSVSVSQITAGPKHVEFKEASRNKLAAGIDAVANAVKVTLGPKGRNVVLERKFGAPEVVNDGVTIAREIELEDPGMNVGAKLLQQVAQQTDLKAGDGTTTSTVLTQAMVNAGIKAVSSGAEPMGLRRGITKTVKLVVEEINSVARPIDGDDDLLNIACISSGSQVMGSIIASAYERVGRLGSTVVEESQTLIDEVDFSEGMELDRGYVSPYFVTDQERQMVEQTDPRILVTDRKLTNVQELVPLLEQFVKSKEPLFIVADSVEGEALSSLILNKMRGVLDVVAIKSPGFGERRRNYLQDICVMTGASFISEELGLTLEQVSYGMLGSAQKVVVAKEACTIVSSGDHAEAVSQRIEQIKKDMESADNEFDKEKGEERIARLGGGIARLKVGAATETELKDKKLRYEDALNAVQAAIEQGVVAGGGCTLVHAIKKHEEWKELMDGEDELRGLDIVMEALKAPIIQIADNAGQEGEVIFEKVKRNDYGVGYNAATDTFENLLEAGVLDPCKVTCWAVENSCSIAGHVLTTEALITEIPTDQSEPGSQMDPGQYM